MEIGGEVEDGGEVVLVIDGVLVTGDGEVRLNLEDDLDEEVERCRGDEGVGHHHLVPPSVRIFPDTDGDGWLGDRLSLVNHENGVDGFTDHVRTTLCRHLGTRVGSAEFCAAGAALAGGSSTEEEGGEPLGDLGPGTENREEDAEQGEEVPDDEFEGDVEAVEGRASAEDADGGGGGGVGGGGEDGDVGADEELGEGGEEGGDDEDQEEEAALLETRQPGGGAFDMEHSNQDDYQVGGQACGGRGVIN